MIGDLGFIIGMCIFLYSQDMEDLFKDHLINIVAHISLMPFPIPRDYFPHILQQAIHQAVLHEADEWFKKDDVILFNPHEVKR